ncbi:MAG TPA: BlaI/MecI/CopY family transcriptional regulator [Vicinamibacteria bacterium]
MSHFLLRGFRRPRATVEGALGHLEREVLERLWASGDEPQSVRQVQQAFDDAVAYTTVLTTLDRLYRKGLTERRRQGRAFLYRARLSRDELNQGVASDVIDSLLGGDNATARPVISTFVDAVGQRDAELLDELERLVRDRKRRQAPKGRAR